MLGKNHISCGVDKILIRLQIIRGNEHLGKAESKYHESLNVFENSKMPEYIPLGQIDHHRKPTHLRQPVAVSRLMPIVTLPSILTRSTAETAGRASRKRNLELVLHGWKRMLAGCSMDIIPSWFIITMQSAILRAKAIWWVTTVMDWSWLMTARMRVKTFWIQSWIQVRGWLVEKHERRMHGQPSKECTSLTCTP